MPFMTSIDPIESPAVMTVSQLNARIKKLLETNFAYVWVLGEISNLKIPASGHAYFTLKDKQSQIRAVMFRAQFSRLKFRPEDGMAVLCQGRLTVYEPQGAYQIVVEGLEPQGRGALQIAFEQLKEKLSREGLFDSARKRPLPLRPQRIAVVTSPTGAAIRDILKVLQRCPYPLTVTLLPVRVQGDEAAPEIARALETISARHKEFGWDLAIVGRGGGSLEDLWPFNEEITARAIAACAVPVMSAVGHEIDVTIADMVADYRAPTPTAAAQWVVNRLEELERRLDDQSRRLRTALVSRVDRLRTSVSRLEGRLVDPRRRLIDWRLAVDDRMDRLLRALDNRIRLWRLRAAHAAQRLQRGHPEKTLAELRGRLDILSRRMVDLQNRDLERRRLQLNGAAARLESLSPLAILARGYSLTWKLPDQTLVRRAAQVQPGDLVRIRLAEGHLTAKVTETAEPEP